MMKSIRQIDIFYNHLVLRKERNPPLKTFKLTHNAQYIKTHLDDMTVTIFRD